MITDSKELPVSFLIVFSLSSVEVDNVGDTLVDLPIKSLLSDPENLVPGEERREAPKVGEEVAEDHLSKLPHDRNAPE